jgi:hypothetical protein
MSSGEEVAMDFHRLGYRRRSWIFVCEHIPCEQVELKGNDFFQDGSSARNVIEGRPAYLPLSESITSPSDSLLERSSVR